MLLITEAALSAELGRNESRPDPRPLHAIRNHLYLPVRYHSFGQISFPGTTPTLVTRAFSPSILLLITEAALSAELGRNESRPDPRPLHAIRNHLYLPVRYHSFGQISFPGTTPTLVTRAFSPSILLLITEAALSAELGRNESRPDPRPLHAIRNHLYLPVRYHSFGQISFPGTTPTLVTRAFSPSILLLITEAALSAELGRNESRPDPRPLHAIRNHLYLPVRYHSFGQISFPGTTPTLVTRAFSPSILLLITEAALSAELGRNESRPDPRPLHAIRNHLYLPVRYHSFGQISFPGTTPTLVTRAFSPSILLLITEAALSAELGRNESRPDPRPLHAIRNHLYLPVRYHSFGQISFPGTTPTLVTRAFSPSILLLITEAALSAELGRNESRPDPRPLHAIRNHLYLPVRYHSFGQISFPGTTPTLVTRAFSPSILLLITEAALSAELGRNESRPDPRPLHAIRNHLYLPVRYHSFGQISFPGTTPTLVTRAFSPSILLLITEAALSAELGRNESRPDPRPLHAIRNHLYLPVRYHSFGQISFPGTTPTLVTRAFSPSILLLITEAALSAELGRNESRPDPRPLHAIRNHLYLPVRYHSFGQISFPGTTPTLVTRAFSPSILLLITEAALSAELGRNESRPDPRPLHAIRNHLYLPVRYHSFGQISFPGTTPTLVTRAFSPSILLLITEAALSAELGPAPIRDHCRDPESPLSASLSFGQISFPGTTPTLVTGSSALSASSLSQLWPNQFSGDHTDPSSGLFPLHFALDYRSSALSGAGPKRKPPRSETIARDPESPLSASSLSQLWPNQFSGDHTDPSYSGLFPLHFALDYRSSALSGAGPKRKPPRSETIARDPESPLSASSLSQLWPNQFSPFSPSILLLTAELGRNESRPNPRPLPTLVTRAFSPSILLLITEAALSAELGRNESRHCTRSESPLSASSLSQLWPNPGTTPTLVTRAFSPSILLLITEAVQRYHSLYLPVRYQALAKSVFRGPHRP